jgi:hypothetical protein
LHLAKLKLFKKVIGNFLSMCCCNVKLSAYSIFSMCWREIERTDHVTHNGFLQGVYRRQFLYVSVCVRRINETSTEIKIGEDHKGYQISPFMKWSTALPNTSFPPKNPPATQGHTAPRAASGIHYWQLISYSLREPWHLFSQTGR